MKGDTCKVDGCEIMVRTGLTCQVHYWRMKKYGSYEKPSRKRHGNTCRAEGCDKERDGRHSVCPMHRSRLSRYRSLEIPVITYPDGIVHECKVHGYLSREESYKNQKTGHFTCIACRRENDRKFFENNPHIDRNSYKTHYYVSNGKVKLEKSEYDRMHKEQKGMCMICKNPEIQKSFKSNIKIKQLAIDHCHSTKKIRGLLCQRCNLMIGYARDSIPILQSAITYLKLHEEKST